MTDVHALEALELLHRLTEWTGRWIPDGATPDQMVMINTTVLELAEVIAPLLREREELRAALRFYAEGEWSDGYPGGIKVRTGDEIALDFGERAQRALSRLSEGGAKNG